VEAHRIFIKEGILKKTSHHGGVERRFYLFNDLLFCTPNTSDPFFSIRLHFLETMTIKDIISPNFYGFQILSYGESFTVQASTPQEKKKEWMKVLEDAITSFQKTFPKTNRETAPVWIADNAAPQCMRCKANFSVISRRHHCRSCGDVVCGDCSPSKAIVPGVNREREVRVCSACKRSLDQKTKK